MAIEGKAIVAEVMVRVAKEEVAQAIAWYKASVEFEDEVNEAVCNAFYKGFNNCKRKVAQTFHLPDLKDIIADEPKEAGADTLIGDEPIEITKVTEPEATRSLLQSLRPPKPSGSQSSQARCGRPSRE